MGGPLETGELSHGILRNFQTMCMSAPAQACVNSMLLHFSLTPIALSLYMGEKLRVISSYRNGPP